MKVVIAPDLHLDITGARRLDPIVAENPDYVVIAGDLAGWDKWDMVFVEFVQQKLKDIKLAFLPGNHEFYSRTKTSVNTILACLEDFCKSMGVIYLPKKNFTVKGVTFIGSPLWYNYEFAPAGRYNEAQLLDGYDAESGFIWNDMRYIAKQQTDPQLATKFLGQFEGQLNRAKRTGKPIIAITHMCPKRELIGHPPGLFNAYSGDGRAGNLLDSLGDQLVHAYCGHTHREVKLGKFTNIGNDYNGTLKYAVVKL